jgi:hypothetical protein
LKSFTNPYLGSFFAVGVRDEDDQLLSLSEHTGDSIFTGWLRREGEFAVIIIAYIQENEVTFS